MSGFDVPFPAGGPPLLTVAAAVYRSFDENYFTFLALRAYHGWDFDLLAVDNGPEPCRRTAAVLRSVGGRYVHRPDLNGTSRPRDACFRYARTPWVMVIDNHVLLVPGAVAAAQAYAAAHPDSRDIVSGPILGDDARWVATHWADSVPSGLWGSWSGDARFREAWALAPDGWDPAAARARAAALPPFEIPAMGLGLWLMRRAAWPGFNPHFRGFGGEEGYIHHKVRQLGGRAVCLPALMWHHKFRDVSGEWQATPYPSSRTDHVRNILIGARELGLAAAAAGVDVLAEATEHFGKEVGGRPGVERLAAEAAVLQPAAGPVVLPRLKVLGVWYTNNAAPIRLLQASLRTVQTAAADSRHEVRVGTCAWAAVPGNPFPEVVAGPDIRTPAGHAAIIKQVRAAWAAATEDGWEPDLVCFLEHDVLYPAEYFTRVGDAAALNPDAPVVSHRDYIGLNATGWQGVRERHEPLHQLALRPAVARANLDRAAADCVRQGWAYLEPDHGLPRADWAQVPYAGFAPAVHVNWEPDRGGGRRFTSHGEVCYEPVSTLGPNGTPLTVHPYWREATAWWPHPQPAARPPAGCGACGKAAPAAATLPGDIEAWFQAARDRPSDFHEHMETFRALAAEAGSVTELCDWGKPARIAAAAAGVPVVSYGKTARPEWAVLARLVGDRFTGTAVADFAALDIAPTGLLFIDRDHRASQVYADLVRHAGKASKYVVVHTATTFGEVGDDGGPGVMPGIRRWLREGAAKEWVVSRFDEKNHGLIVLSRDAARREPVKLGLREAARYLKTRVKHALAGGTYLPLPMALERLGECHVCDKRGGAEGNNCTVCKCFLARVPDTAPVNRGQPGKVFFPTESCPIGKWNPRPDDGVKMTPEEVAAMLDGVAAAGEARA